MREMDRLNAYPFLIFRGGFLSNKVIVKFMYTERRGFSVDWNAIKTEYVTTDTSYRKLAKKYKVSMTQIGIHSKEEEWVKEKKRFLEKTYTKTINAIASKQADRVARLHTIADKILDKIEQSVDLLDATEIQAYRQIAATVKDIKEIQMLKSDADMREQEARIANLRKQAEEEKEDRNIIVKIASDAEDYAE